MLGPVLQPKLNLSLSVSPALALLTAGAALIPVPKLEIVGRRHTVLPAAAGA
jgi:hypothetical protein